LKHQLIIAFSDTRVHPARVVEALSIKIYRPCRKSERIPFINWLEARGISRLVHFTALENVPNILKYGLIPREYLQLEVVQLALGGLFSDDQRLDGLPHYNCLSISSPNYRMFSRKRDKKDYRWAVLELNPKVISHLYCLFSPTNAASANSKLEDGVSGAERLFDHQALRNDLGLLAFETTDPQAETLCDSIIRPQYISQIYVSNRSSQNWLSRKGISANIDQSLFDQRRDYLFWKNKKITDIESSL
jgi:hypothetical protein